MKTIKLFVILMIPMVAFAQSGPINFKNPILPGFHPDPSICKVGDDYYLVNSSFEWFPGLPIYHSKDLVNWKLIGHGLSRPDQIELPVGLADSRGMYAPSIRYNKGVFYLICTCVKCEGNFYVTATDPAGPWSAPVWLKSRGIDPSLFWDDDGRCYYTGHANISNINDWPAKNGVWMQELDLGQKKLIGERVQLTHGHAKNARWTEGPHLYKIDGKYILMVAEGGTGFHHGVTVHHSDSLWGPYIPYHSNPIMTHRHLGKDYPIHSVGHADLIQTQNGEWWSVMLGKRLVEGKTLLARETFLASVSFENEEGYPLPVVNPGEGKLLFEQKRPDLPWTLVEKAAKVDEFDQEKLDLEWCFLRTPYDEWYDLGGGKLSLKLRSEVVDSFVNPSLIARRIVDYNFMASVQMTFTGTRSNEQAGLILYRNSKNHFQLVKEKRELVLIKTMAGVRQELIRVPYSGKTVVLDVKASGLGVTFSYGTDNSGLKNIGGEQDLILLSDETAGGFNGPFIGMYATGNGKASRSKAVFDWFKYEGLD